MKYTLIDQSTLKIPIEGMYRGIPWQISVEDREGYWYSKWQVVLAIPSPTGDASDWIHLDIGCLTKEQAVMIAKHHALAFNIPDERVKIQHENGWFETLNDKEFNGKIN